MNAVGALRLLPECTNLAQAWLPWQNKVERVRLSNSWLLMVAGTEKWFQAGRVRVPTKQRIRKRPEPESVAPAPTAADSSASPAVAPLAAASPNVVLASGGDTQPQPPPDKSYKPNLIYHVTGEKGWLWSSRRSIRMCLLACCRTQSPSSSASSEPGFSGSVVRRFFAVVSCFGSLLFLSSWTCPTQHSRSNATQCQLVCAHVHCVHVCLSHLFTCTAFAQLHNMGQAAT